MDKEKNNKEKGKRYIKEDLNTKHIKLDKNDIETQDIQRFQSLTAKHISRKEERKIIRPESTRLSANINNYRFLFDSSNKESIDNTKWVLHLRIYDDYKKGKKKLLGEPSFYQSALDKFLKYKRNKLTKSKSAFGFNTLSNFSQYRHIFKRYNDNHGTTITGPLLNFNLNLRNDRVLTPPQHKWISNTSDDSKKYYYSCSNFYKNKLPGKISENNIMRPYKYEFSKSEYNGNKLIIRTIKKDDRKAYNIMGRHLSSKPYNDNYTEKNMNQIKELFKCMEQSQSRTWYHIKLRNFNDNKKEETIHKNKKKIKRFLS